MSRFPSSLLFLLALAAPVGCGSESGVSQGDPTGPGSGLGDGGAGEAGTGVPEGPKAQGVFLLFGDDVTPTVRDRVKSLLDEAFKAPVTVVTEATAPAALGKDAMLLAFGNTKVSREVLGDAAITALGPEAYLVKSAPRGEGVVLAAVGAPAKKRPHGNLGTLHAVYTALEELGFAFLHPLAPTKPESLRLPAAPVNRVETPRWEKREIHLHTMHPLELTEVLQGWGPGGHQDAAGFEAMMPEWERFLEWCVANQQNGVEWFLLWAESWKEFADSPTRMARLRKLVDKAHAYGISAGIDAPIAFAQQHSYRLLRTQGELPAELAQIRARIDDLMTADFDFFGIEAGTSEFTAPAPERMLAWMNEATKHLDEKYKVPNFIKVHASTGQTAKGYADPNAPGKDINFNFLPHYADPRLGVLPHTVQHYSLTDPAPTYGNTNFGYIRTFLQEQVGRRPVVWYPETAYWVSFDVDVPLFLPIYAERRLYDLRLLASDEDKGLMGRGVHAGKHMDGQLIFSSGWEWGYWLNDVIAARAAWNPRMSTGDHGDAFAQALEPAMRVFGAAAPEVTALIVDTVKAEQALLIEGRIKGSPPASIYQRSGQAYLQGSETWDDVSKLVDETKMTQPTRLGLVDMRNPLHGGPGYSKEVEPLLAEMKSTFGALADRAQALESKIPSRAAPLFKDISATLRMTALRARQVHGLYDYVDGYFDTAQAKRLARLQDARSALDAAVALVKTQEANYRVPADRIAGWRPNPTAYAYGYLWTVRSLHYWWRDEGKAVDAPVSPCYMNVINPVDVAFGEGMGTDFVRFLGGALSADDQRGCLAEPEAEPKYPQDNLRSRPK
jgi:hypothetical protein